MFDMTSGGATAIQASIMARAARLADLSHELEEATQVIYEQTRQWYDSSGDGTWPQLAESTIQRKEVAGAGDPEKPLYFEGNLYDSVTSPSGPYSFSHSPGDHSVVIGVDWLEGAWQIPVVLHSGTNSAGRNHDVTIPARPIWPSHSSEEYRQIREQVRAIMTKRL